jgi:hypothetical protein
MRQNRNVVSLISSLDDAEDAGLALQVGHNSGMNSNCFVLGYLS